MGALVREGHPHYIGEGGGGGSATFMQGGREVEESILHERGCGLVK